MANDKIISALYLLPTGLSDVPPSTVLPTYNIEIMRGLRHFIVENVRTARRWIRKCDPAFSFEGVEFMELNVHTHPSEVCRMLEPLRLGMPVGVMSEAGCPAVADPGADVVAIAQKEGLRIIPLVGPSSIIMGLMGSGFNGQSFCFHGYLPIDDRDKRRFIQALERESERENRTQIFIETPYRNNKLLQLMSETLMPDTEICVASDITAPGESIVTMSAASWKNKKYDYSKKPAIYLVYRRGAGKRNLKGDRRKR